MSKDRSYEDDDVRAIIERALQTNPDRGLSHDDLLSVGAGVGLSSEAIERAAQEVREARATAVASASVVSRRRRGLAIHASVFLVLNAFLFAINFLTTPGEWWVLFSVFGWGLALLLHAGFAVFSGISPGSLERKRKQALGQQPSTPARISERRTGVRVQGPLDQIEEPEASEAQTSQRRE